MSLRKQSEAIMVLEVPESEGRYGKEKSFITGDETTEASGFQGGDGFINDDYDGCFKR